MEKLRKGNKFRARKKPSVGLTTSRSSVLLVISSGASSVTPVSHQSHDPVIVLTAIQLISKSTKLVSAFRLADQVQKIPVTSHSQGKSKIVRDHG